MVRFKPADANVEITAYWGSEVQRLTPSNDGYYTVCVDNGDGIFVTVNSVVAGE